MTASNIPTPEKVARAIAAEECPYVEGSGPAVIWIEANWIDSLPHAHKAIAAMREPSEGMVTAGNELSPIARGTETHRMNGGVVPEDYWRVMIDAALTEERG